MQWPGKPSWWRGLGYLALAGVALASGGCVAAAVGIVAAGAAGGAGYVYYKGSVPQEFRSSYEQTWGATRAALDDLGMPLLNADHDDGGILLESRTGTGDRVEIRVEKVAVPLPVEGPVTRVNVRVSVFGDQAISARILAMIQTRLAQPTAVVPVAPQGPPVNVVPASLLAAPRQTAPPPLAEPAKQ